MPMKNFILILLLLLILGGAILYIYKKKKSGAKCIGCPDGNTCGHQCTGCSGHCCSSHKEN